MCLSEHGAPNPPVAHHVFTNNCCFDLFWRYVPFSLTHPHTHTPVIMILLRGATISYIITGVCVCVRVARTSHYILINWFGWYPRISDYIRCVSTWFKMHVFIFRTYVCIYIYIHIHTSPQTPTFAHELCQEQAKKTANPFNTGCSCRNCGWVKIWGLNGLSIDTDQTKLGVNRDLTKHCGMFNHRNGIPSGKLTWLWKITVFNG